ncbi:MAG: hypothetical protein WBB27_09660 [Maribacter sp.]
MGYSKVDTNQKTIVNPYFSDNSKDYVYKASVTVFSNYLGGILVIKKINSEEHRVVFTTEMGNTIFDFSFKDDDFKVNRIIKQMDKKLLINILEKDFRDLVTEKLLSQEFYFKANEEIAKVKINKKLYFYTYANSRLRTISRIGNQKEKVVFEFSKINGDIAERIKIIHKNINLKIELTSI